MKMSVGMIALAGVLAGSGGAFAFDLGPGHPDFEARERSERLHVSRGSVPADARASASPRIIKGTSARYRATPTPATKCKIGDLCSW